MAIQPRISQQIDHRSPRPRRRTALRAAGLPAVYELLKPFLIAVGRGKVLQPLTPEEGETLMNWIDSTGRQSDFTVATTEAPSFRRVVLERMRSKGMTGEQIRQSGATRSYGIRDGTASCSFRTSATSAPRAFSPCPSAACSTTTASISTATPPLFRQLHDPTHFEDRCGVCDYGTLCGGSRARAFAATGNPLGSDPFCMYEPHAHAHANSANQPEERSTE